MSKYESQINKMSQAGPRSINMINCSADLENWNQKIGFEQPLPVAAFEPYHEDAVIAQNTSNNNNNNNTINRQRSTYETSRHSSM